MDQTEREDLARKFIIYIVENGQFKKGLDKKRERDRKLSNE